MKTKGMLVVIILLVALVVTATAQAQSLTLRYKYTAGEIQKGALKGAFTGTVQPSGQGEMPIGVNVDGVFSTKTVSVSDASVASQEMKLDRLQVTTDVMNMQMQMVMEGGKVTCTLNGEPMQLPDNTPGLGALGAPIKGEVDTRGRVLKMDLSAMGDVAGGFDPTMLGEMSVLFPEGPVAPGDTWSQEMKIPLTVMKQKMEMAVNFTYTFAGVEKYQDKDVAHIDLKGTTVMTGGESAMQVKQTFSGYELFDFNAGRQAYDKIKMQQTMTHAGAEGQPGMSMSMVGDFEVTVQ